MSNPLVSVITPAYNAQEFIGQTIESVINQTYPHWEMSVVDDGSTDNTRQVVKKYLSDSRIRYLYQENQERSIARNHGISRSSGKYIAFLDADDLWLPDKLKMQVAYLDTHPEVGLCFTHYTQIDCQGSSMGMQAINFASTQDPFYQLLKTNFIANSTVMIPRSVLDKVGLFDETLPVFGSEDWDMWLRITHFYPIYFVNKPLMLYRLHESNTTPLDKMYLSAKAVLEKVFSDPTLPTHIVDSKRKIYTLMYCAFSGAYLKVNQRKTAFKYWQSAFEIDPKIVLLTKEGLWTTLKLFLPYLLIAYLPRLRLLLKAATLPTNNGNYHI